MKYLFVLFSLLGAELVNETVVVAEQVSETVNLEKALSKHAGLSESQAKVELDHVFSAISAELKSGNGVEVKRFGRFYLAERKVKSSKSASADQKQVPAEAAKVRRYARFTPSEALKIELNK